MTDLDLDICDLATTRSFDLSQYSITITIEKSNTQQPSGLIKCHRWFSSRMTLI